MKYQFAVDNEVKYNRYCLMINQIFALNGVKGLTNAALDLFAHLVQTQKEMGEDAELVLAPFSRKRYCDFHNMKAPYFSNLLKQLVDRKLVIDQGGALIVRPDLIPNWDEDGSCSITYKMIVR